MRVVGRWSVAVRGSRFVDGGSRFAILLLRRHTIVARNVCYADVRAVWHVSRVVGDTHLADLVSDIQPMSIDAGCGGSRLGTHSSSTHGALPARI